MLPRGANVAASAATGRVLAAAATVAALALVALLLPGCGGGKERPKKPAYEIAFGGNLPREVTKGSPVRSAGINIGEVTSVRRTAETVVVKIELEGKFATLIRGGSYAVARPRIFLEGAYFLDVSPGNPRAAPLPSGSTIPGR